MKECNYPTCAGIGCVCDEPNLISRLWGTGNPDCANAADLIATLRSENEKLKAEMAAELDVLWGVGEISTFIKRTKRQTYYLLEHGMIPARKVGGLWTSSKRGLARALCEFQFLEDA